MATFRGGMEFQQGPVISLLSTPMVMPSYPLRLKCSCQPKVTEGQHGDQGQLLAEPSSRAMNIGGAWPAPLAGK